MASFKIIQKFGTFFCNKRRSDEGTSRFQVKNVQFFGRKCMVYVSIFVSLGSPFQGTEVRDYCVLRLLQRGTSDILLLNLKANFKKL